MLAIREFFVSGANMTLSLLTLLTFLFVLNSCDKEDELLSDLPNQPGYVESPDDGGNEDNSGNGGGNGSSSKGSAPSFTRFNSTATTKSITVYFYYEGNPSSATIYYGENSPSKAVNTHVSSRCCSATISGLKPATVYYFKCKAKNAYGTTTSQTYSEMTFAEPW